MNNKFDKLTREAAAFYGVQPQFLTREQRNRYKMRAHMKNYSAGPSTFVRHGMSPTGRVIDTLHVTVDRVIILDSLSQFADENVNYIIDLPATEYKRHE